MSRIFFLLVFISFGIKAQENFFFNLDSIKAFAKRDSLRKDSIKNFNLNLKWDNKTFNPFKNEEIHLPRQFVQNRKSGKAHRCLTSYADVGPEALAYCGFKYGRAAVRLTATLGDIPYTHL